MKTPVVGDSVHYYRDQEMPGKRGPYPAKILAVHADKTDEGHVSVRLHITGELGGSWAEDHIPILDGVQPGRATRYCVYPPEVRQESTPPVS